MHLVILDYVAPLNLSNLFDLLEVNLLRLAKVGNIYALAFPLYLDVWRRDHIMPLSGLLLINVPLVGLLLVDGAHKLISQLNLLFFKSLSLLTGLALASFLLHFRLDLEFVLLHDPV